MTNNNLFSKPDIRVVQKVYKEPLTSWKVRNSTMEKMKRMADAHNAAYVDFADYVLALAEAHLEEQQPALRRA